MVCVLDKGKSMILICIMKGNGKEIIGEFFHADNSFLIKTVFSLENKSAICTFLSVKSIKS